MSLWTPEPRGRTRDGGRRGAARPHADEPNRTGRKPVIMALTSPDAQGTTMERMPR
ncbi:hypothetical protein [Streptomyces sp. NPDC057690]|uniref:hypothetical protein n=1 Tax=Streptomyces sp. NPDC057690 TaxID=3346214 RepID=UPI0036B5C098